MSIPATSVTYEHNNSELLQGGLIVKGIFPDGGTTVTVPVDSLFDDDLVIPVTQSSISGGSQLQEVLASRVVGIPGQITLSRIDQFENSADSQFALLIIRKGLGRHLSNGSPAVSLLYNHPGGMYVFGVTTVAGASQTVNLPGIFLQSSDKIVVLKTNLVSQSAIIEVKASRSDYPTESIVLATAGTEDLLSGDTVIIVVFKCQSYSKINSASSISATSFRPIQGPFGPMDLAGSKTSATGNILVIDIPYLTSDSVIIPILTIPNAKWVKGACEIYSSRSAGVLPGTTHFYIAETDSDQGAIDNNVTAEYIIVQSQGRKL